MDSEREFKWRAASVADAAKPQVHVVRNQVAPFLDANSGTELTERLLRFRQSNARLIAERKK